jgi:hypothetical protein
MRSMSRTNLIAYVLVGLVHHLTDGSNLVGAGHPRLYAECHSEEQSDEESRCWDKKSFHDEKRGPSLHEACPERSRRVPLRMSFINT